MRLVTAVVVAGAALLGAVGCGGESPEDVAVAFIEAVEEEDTEAACELVTSDLREASEERARDITGEPAPGLQGDIDREVLEASEALASDCASGVPIIEFPEASESAVEGDTAEVEVTGSGDETAVVDLVDEDGEWRVDGVSEP